MKIDYKDYIEYVKNLPTETYQREDKIQALFYNLQEKENSHLLVKVAGDEFNLTNQ